MIWLAYLILLLVAAAGLLLVTLTLPGLWLMCADAAAYALITRGRYLGLKSLLAIIALAAIAEVLELFLGKRSTHKAGGGRAAMIGAAVGGTAGGIFLTFIPIPILGTILGICLGTFLGAAGVELFGDKQMAHSLRVGWGAAKGRVWGLLAKLAVGGLMLLLIVWRGWP